MAKIRKRIFKRKRFVKKRRFFKRRRPMPKYDGMIRVKMMATKQLMTGDATGTGSMLIKWGDQISAPSTTTLKPTDCEELDRYFTLYRDFCIQGVKVKFIPYRFSAGAILLAHEETLIGSQAQGGSITATNVRLAVDFNAQSQMKPVHKYVGVAKSRMKNSGDTVTSAVSGDSRWISTSNITKTYHSGHTFISTQIQGLAADVPLGMMTATYYFWFKGQRIDN